MVLIVCARAPSLEATWCLSTPVVARLTPEGVPTALRPRLAAGLPFAPKHWQIHHLPFIDSAAPLDPLNPRNSDFISPKSQD